MPFIAVIPVLCLSGFVHGLSGFGFGLVAMGVLPLLMDFKDAIVVVTILNVVVSVITFCLHRARFEWRPGAALLLGAGAGVPLGVALLAGVGSVVLLRLLGALMCLFAVNELVLSRKWPGQIPARFGLLFGLLSGGLGGAFNMGGPPAVAYAWSQPWSKEQIVALLQVVFGLSAVLRLALLGGAGMLGRHALEVSFWALLPVLLALLAGGAYLQKIPVERLKPGVALFLAAMGIKYLLFT
ncbi:MAG: sulfite exporter TauE/SafE family protein [Verrucomicrobia bacterium]|nr:sulfite exporter TauE/SafE family protein [Verrucomicrobiota bacterium]